MEAATGLDTLSEREAPTALDAPTRPDTPTGPDKPAGPGAARLAHRTRGGQPAGKHLLHRGRRQAGPAQRPAENETRARRVDPRQAAGGGDVKQRVLDAVGSAPGKSVAEYAELLDLSPTALDRPVRELTSDRALVKRARQLYLP